jgi:glycosyltransferase involved in cell wall biosynthesis
MGVRVKGRQLKILFIHQNFPGQFKHLAGALAARGHNVKALTLRVNEVVAWNGVQVLPYAVARKGRQALHLWMTDMDSKVTRAEACFHAACKLRDAGFSPDVIIAHPGWGESLFLRDVWPEARMGIYCELYHLPGYPHLGFDPEFRRANEATEPLRIRMKNINNHLHFDIATAGLSPTAFQADTFPPGFRDRISVVHDGIDTEQLRPDPNAGFTLPTGHRLTRADEVITFVNRNLEPYRGYHVFMRALPALLAARPQAQVLIVGGDGVSYGAQAPQGQTWKQIYIDEVRGQIPDADWARVHFLGRIPYDDFRAMLQVARVHVYLTYPFVLSWSLLEAMASGAAIVASDTGPVREVLRHGETGQLVDFFDGAGLVREVAALADDPAARARLGAAARAHVIAHYDLKTHCLPAQIAWVESLGLPVRS